MRIATDKIFNAGCPDALRCVERVLSLLFVICVNVAYVVGVLHWSDLNTDCAVVVDVCNLVWTVIGVLPCLRDA